MKTRDQMRAGLLDRALDLKTYAHMIVGALTAEIESTVKSGDSAFDERITLVRCFVMAEGIARRADRLSKELVTIKNCERDHRTAFTQEKTS